MMQTVNASLMKATVQDMQTYLHHLERLLGMDLQANPHRMDLSHRLDNPHRMGQQMGLHQSVSYNMEQPQNEQSVLVTHLERLSQSIRVLDIKIDSHMTAISELSNRIAQVEESQQELIAQSNNIPCMNIKDYQFESPLLSTTIADDCTLLSSSADAIFSSDSMQSITVCKMDAPVNEIIIPSAVFEPIQNAVVVEAPIAEAPKVTEVSVIEAPKVIEVPVVEALKVTEVSVVEAPKVIEVPVVEAPKVEVLSVESSQEANSDQKADGEEEQEADGEEEEVVEEEEEEEQEVEEITYNGETYYKDADGFIYRPDDDTPIGYWKEKTQSIAFYRTKK